MGNADDLETRNESGRAPAGPGRGTINAEACHFVSASARRGWAGRSARSRRGRSAGSTAMALRPLQRLGAAQRARRERGARWRWGCPLGERLGPGAVCRGPRGLVRGCMPPHASGWAPPGRKSAPGARGRQEVERAGAGLG